MKKALSLMLAVLMLFTTVAFPTAVADDTITVTFIDKEGATVATAQGAAGSLLSEIAPELPAVSGDGILTYAANGWSADGVTVVDMETYTLSEDITLSALYNVYGAKFDSDPIAINKPAEDGTIPQQDLLPSQVTLDPNSHGITVVYKVEGVDEQIIADNWITYVNGRTLSSGQWNKTTVTGDGTPINYLEFNNGYYYIYLNQNINGTHGLTPKSLDTFLVFCPDNGTRYFTDRTPTNTNENATFRMLAVVNDNLQPTVTFHNEDGSVITTYQHKYTDVWKSYQLSYTTDCYKEGQLLTPNAIFLLAQQADTTIAAPEKDGMVLKGWADSEGNLVEGVYYNADLYPVFADASEIEKVTATFEDKDGNTVATYEINKDSILTEAAPEIPAVAGDGIRNYAAKGWAVNGTIVDPAAYVFSSDVTFVATYDVYGTEFDSDPIAINKPGEDGTIPQQDLLPSQVTLDPNSHGITVVYKVEGVDEQIIADNWITYMNGNKYSSGQWNKTTVTGDGTPINYLEFNNGYYYIYLNQNINGTHGLTPKSLDTFLVFCPDNGTRYFTDRTPTNTNENATFQMLAVVNDNLQPTVTFHNEDGSVLTTYQHKYTDVWKSYQLSYTTECYKEGQVLTPNAIFLLAQQADATLAMPEKDNMILSGWEDADGNVVDAVYKNIDVYPVFREASDEDKVTATFVDKEGNTVATLKNFPGYLLPEAAPEVPEAKADGICTYVASGWAVNGSIVDPDEYVLTEDVTFVATYTVYGTKYEDAPIAINKPGEDGTIAEQNLLPSEGTLAPDSVGFTMVFKVNGADEEIIADNFVTWVNGDGRSSGQWNKTTVTGNGNPVNYLELNNGYYFMYLNKSINGTRGATPKTLDKFFIFSADNGTRYSTERTPTNTNENATFQMLAVANDNLQPTVTFHNEDGSVLTTYQHKYTDVWKDYNLTYDTNSYEYGKLLSPTAIFTLAQAEDSNLVMPEKEGMILDGWVDKEGNKVDAVYCNVDVYPSFREPTEEDVCTITFADKDGNAVATMQNYVGYTIPEAAPAIPEVESDGIIQYVAKGWAIDGTITDPATYTLDGDVTFTAEYTVYGARFEDTEAIVIGDGSAAQELLPESVKLDPASHGITVVYKVEGVTEEIIADNFVLGTNGQEYSAQWGNQGYANDGNNICYLEFNNGYYYMYLNQNINGTHGKTPDILNKFSIFNENDTVNNKYVTDRTPVNNNEGATFRMLAVLSDNLQPTVTFHDAQGNEYYSLKYNYTNINAHIGFAESFTALSNSCIEGKLLSGDEMFEAVLASDSSMTAPYKGLGYAFDGWVDAEGNKVDAVYCNVDLYPTYRKVSYYDVTFVDGEKVLYETAANEGDYAEYAGDKPVKDFDGEYLYTFAGWAIENDEIVDPSSVAITAATTFYAVYTKTEHVHSFVTTGAGTATCVDEICGKVFTDAFTIIADENVEVTEMKAGETVKVPVIVNNGTFVGATLNVTTSDNVTVTDIDVTGTLFEGHTAQFAESIVLNAALEGNNITADGIIVYLELTANADIAAEETITVEINAEQVVNIADDDITADVADGYVATYTATAAEAEVILWGDVTGDGKIDGTDAMYLNRYASGWAKADYAAATKLMELGDITGEGNVDGTDAMYLNRYASGWAKADYEAAGRLIESLNYLESIKAE